MSIPNSKSTMVFLILFIVLGLQSSANALGGVHIKNKCPAKGASCDFIMSDVKRCGDKNEKEYTCTDQKIKFK